MYVQTIYESRAHTRITRNDIAKIAAKAMPHNRKKGITSFMYYDDWRFLQVIEGRPAQVAETMKRIVACPLHHSFKVRLMNRNMVRGFEEWHFGTMHADDFELRRILKNMGYADLFQTNVLEALKVLKRAAGRKYRIMDTLQKRALEHPPLVEDIQVKVSLGEEILGLRG